MVYTGDIEEDALNSALSMKLQDYMIPSVYRHRKDMIFNMNGKIDRKALRKEYIQE